MAIFEIDITSNVRRRGEDTDRETTKQVAIDVATQAQAIRLALILWDIEPPFTGTNRVSPPVPIVRTIR